MKKVGMKMGLKIKTDFPQNFGLVVYGRIDDCCGLSGES